MKILQKGRSMIEMLGVLAIIGVLSIGGLLGYRRAVNNHQANTILDDANRLAFVVMENDRPNEPNTVITDDFDFVPTGIYHMDAFLGTAAGQFGIVVTDVPKGVCEALLPKASAEYTVRVLPAKTADNVQQLSAYGMLYDEQNTDICNDTNDVALYFGDVSKQCTSEANTECTSNADCCGGEFCAFENAIDCSHSTKGPGECQSILSFTPKTSENGIWTHSEGTMSFWSAQNWCDALGLNSVERDDIGCGGLNGNTTCTTTQSPFFQYIQNVQKDWRSYGYHWLEDYNNYWKADCYAWTVRFGDQLVYYAYRYSTLYALCH